jgi:hypothetical protein
VITNQSFTELADLLPKLYYTPLVSLSLIKPSLPISLLVFIVNIKVSFLDSS